VIVEPSHESFVFSLFICCDAQCGGDVIVLDGDTCGVC